MRSRPTLLAAAGLLLWAGCAHLRGGGASDQDVELSPDLYLRRLAPNVWVHTTHSAPADGSVPANGLLVLRERDSVLVDTGWTPAQARQLVAWARDVARRPVRTAIVTHAHPDRIGGMSALAELGIPVLALDLTAERAKGQGAAPTETFRGAANVDGLEVFFPGPGHTPDNVVVWIPKARVLFAGCLVKAASATDLGNLADSDPGAWPASLKAAAGRFPNAQVVVPGHGKPGGPELIAHTLELLGAAK